MWNAECGMRNFEILKFEIRNLEIFSLGILFSLFLQSIYGILSFDKLRNHPADVFCFYNLK